MAATQFGIALPQVHLGDDLSTDAILSFAQGAEALGYCGLWTQDQVIGSANVLDGLGLLTFVAAVTRSIRLGVSVIVLPHREPVVLAKSLATLDQLSHGRLDLGLGLGNPHPHQGVFGISEDDSGARLRRFREGLRVMRTLWRDGTATYTTDGVSVTNAPMEPKPVQRPYPTTWFGGHHPNALRRAVREADGWMGAGSSTTAQFLAQAKMVREHLDVEGREPGNFKIAKRVYLAVDDNEARAERRLRAWFENYYGNAEMASRVCVWGSLGKVVDAVGSVIDAGAESILLNPVFDYPEHQQKLAQGLGISSNTSRAGENISARCNIQHS
jgi:probable F420-dependent oxidoreductase